MNEWDVAFIEHLFLWKTPIHLIEHLFLRENGDNDSLNKTEVWIKGKANSPSLGIDLVLPTILIKHWMLVKVNCSIECSKLSYAFSLPV